MNIVDKIIFSLLRPMLTPAVRKVLHNKLPPEGLQQVIRDTWRSYDKLSQELPDEATMGAKVMIRLAATTIGLYKSLCKAELSREEAIKFSSQVTWLIYKKLQEPLWKFTWLLTRSNLCRVYWAMYFAMRFFPYRSSGYEMQFVRVDDDTVDFDVHRCPVAKYFASQGLSELCVNSFCNLDFPLADIWGVTLNRPQTLAGGATHCDFRFRACHEKDKTRG